MRDGIHPVFNCSLGMNVFSFHAIRCVRNLNFHTPAVSDWMYSVFCNSRCLKLNFGYCCSKRIDVFPLIISVLDSVSRTPAVQDPIHFVFPCYSRRAELNFVRICNLRTDAFPLICLFRGINLYFVSTFSVRLDVFPLLWPTLGLHTLQFNI